ncbi:MAG: DsrE family protein [Candidatus Latescibacteria bacterium]|nr:DsrE family protein [Candidatus Latescibacterota bacterium]
MVIFTCSHFTFLNAQEKKAEEPSKLLVVWTSGDKDVAIKMVYMYTYNAKKQGWFDRVRFVVWGPSSKLLAEDKELQDYLKKMKNAGVEIQACIACANMYGVTERLRELGIEVKGMGVPLTEMLKTGWTTMTF